MSTKASYALVFKLLNLKNFRTYHKAVSSEGGLLAIFADSAGVTFFSAEANAFTCSLTKALDLGMETSELESRLELRDALFTLASVGLTSILLKSSRVRTVDTLALLSLLTASSSSLLLCILELRELLDRDTNFLRGVGVLSFNFSATEDGLALSLSAADTLLPDALLQPTLFRRFLNSSLEVCLILSGNFAISCILFLP